MKKRTRKSLIQVFDKTLKANFPHFTYDSSYLVPSGWRVYVWKWSQSATVFLTVCTSELSDEYTLEVAWSGHHRYPSHLGVMVPVDIPQCAIKRDCPQDEEFRFRIGHLLPAHEDVYWKASRRPGLSDSFSDLASAQFDLGDISDEEYEDLGLIVDNVGDAIDGFRKWVIPYLQESLGPPD